MSRVQLALNVNVNVNDLDESIAFYTKLFNTEPAKIRPGYANFAVTEPPLKLVLIDKPGQGGSINHLGVEVSDADTVESERTRLADAGFLSIDERGTTCCYPKRTSSGSSARRTANAGRSTPCSKTARHVRTPSLR